MPTFNNATEMMDWLLWNAGVATKVKIDASLDASKVYTDEEIAKLRTVVNSITGVNPAMTTFLEQVSNLLDGDINSAGFQYNGQNLGELIATRYSEALAAASAAGAKGDAAGLAAANAMQAAANVQGNVTTLTGTVTTLAQNYEAFKLAQAQALADLSADYIQRDSVLDGKITTARNDAATADGLIRNDMATNDSALRDLVATKSQQAIDNTLSSETRTKQYADTQDATQKTLLDQSILDARTDGATALAQAKQAIGVDIATAKQQAIDAAQTKVDNEALLRQQGDQAIQLQVTQNTNSISSMATNLGGLLANAGSFLLNMERGLAGLPAPAGYTYVPPVFTTAPAAPAIMGVTAWDIAGSAEPGAQIIVVNNGGNSVGPSVQADANGHWNVVFTSMYVVPGDYIFVVTQTNSAGIVSPTAVTQLNVPN